MKIATAVLTWNRLLALQSFLKTYSEHPYHHRFAVFEDGGIQDNTVDYIQKMQGFTSPISRIDLEALQINDNNGINWFLGTDNLGVSGNTNRALRWFLNESGCDYLCICNDDIIVKGEFARFYADAWKKTGIGLFCYCGFTSKAYEWDEIDYKGITVKKLGRMTGAVMAMPRELVERIGYFDTRFGKFGEEHVDYTNRARFAGFQDINGESQTCLDAKHDFLGHMDIESTVPHGPERQKLSYEASAAFRTVDYMREGFYRPFALQHATKVGGTEQMGLLRSAARGYYDVGVKEPVSV
jgi:GT2 family glycosyltransferase